MLCPWDSGKPQIDAVLDTIKDTGLMGYMHTTWHTLTSSKGPIYVVLMGIGGFESIKDIKMKSLIFDTVSIDGKVC